MPPTNVRRSTSQPISLSRLTAVSMESPRRSVARRGRIASEFERDVHPEFARRLIILLDRRRAGGDRTRDHVLIGQVRSIEGDLPPVVRSEEHTSELQSLMRISYAVFCL